MDWVEEHATSVLYIEDDEKLARLTARYFESHGIRVALARDAQTGVEMALRERPDVILLDLMLPGANGFEVCRTLRARLDTPILMVTARGEEADRVMGLEGGADDYIAKPFSSRELVARVRAHARRARGMTGPANSLVRAGPLEIDSTRRRARFRGEELSLTTYEFDLLYVLAARAGRVLSREQLVNLVRGNPEESFDRSIDVHVSHLRKKLSDDPRNPSILKTVRGVGYLLSTERM